MILNEKQQKGLDMAITRYDLGMKYTVIAGYAGTGKSTLVRAIIESLDIDESDVCYACFTGKAAQVLQKKGNKNVLTLHKLLYEHIPKPDGKFIRRIKTEIRYKLIVVDEVSMAPKELMELLFKHPCHVICLGDPFQLPPVDKDQDNHLLDEPHIFLDEIMRQDEDSEIIKLSMLIREGKPIHKKDFTKDVKIIDKSELTTGMLTWADQILCATNKTRVSINNQMRDLLGRGDQPEDGDKIICLRNYWDDFDNMDNPLVNGTIGYLKSPYSRQITLPKWYGYKKYTGLYGGFETDSGSKFLTLFMDKNMILTGEPTLDNRMAYKISRDKKYGNFIPMAFAYGYCITCHKSQGSEWDKVLVIEENFPFDKEEHARWLYTAVTRASEKIVLVR